LSSNNIIDLTIFDRNNILHSLIRTYKLSRIKAFDKRFKYTAAESIDDIMIEWRKQSLIFRETKETKPYSFYFNELGDYFNYK
jgi:hypothetical protein